jgi:hypothetical protein
VAALKNPKHEAFCREVAGGLNYRQAWVAIGNNLASNNFGKLARRPEVQARIAELQEEFNRHSTIGLRYLQEKLLPIATSDVTRYFKRVCGGKLKLRDVTKLPAELRAALSEMRIDPDGTVTIKPWDKIGAINSLLKTVGGFAPQRIELTGREDAPIETFDALPPLDVIRRLTWSVREALRSLDLVDREQGALWVRRTANELLGRREDDAETFDEAETLPPMECAKEALRGMVGCAKQILRDPDAARFTVGMLRDLATAIEHDITGGIAGPAQAGGS